MPRSQTPMSRAQFVDMFTSADTMWVSHFFGPPPTRVLVPDPTILAGQPPLDIMRNRIIAFAIDDAWRNFASNVPRAMRYVRQHLNNALSQFDRMLGVADRYTLNADIRNLQQSRRRQGHHTPIADDMADADESGPVPDQAPPPVAPDLQGQAYREAQDALLNQRWATVGTTPQFYSANESLPPVLPEFPVRPRR